MVVNNSAVRELWDRTYLALLPWTDIPRRELDAQCRQAVLAALALLWGGCDDDLLDGAATDDQVHAIVAAQTVYGLGWRDAVLGDIPGRAHAAGLGDGPGRLWAPPERWNLGRGRAFRATLRDNLGFFARHPRSQELRLVRTVRAAVAAADADPRTALTLLYRAAWTEHATERLGWSDAEWWQYLGIDELTTWAVIALRIPMEEPDRAGWAVEEVAEAVSPPEWTWDGTGLPDEFLEAAFDTLALPVREF